MKKYNISTLLGIVIFMSITSNQVVVAKRQKLAPSREFSGNCVREVGIKGNKETRKCNNNVVNVMFPDGYVSFQFNSIIDGGKEEILTFVGHKIGVTPGGKDNVRVMMVEDINSTIQPEGKIYTKSVLGSFCALSFKNAERINFNEITGILCFYEEGSAAISYNLSDAYMSVPLHQN